MTRSASVAQLSPEFNDFLFAPIVEDRHGMPLSVLSALARLDVDPWQEAAHLAALPREAAIQRLTQLIAQMPGGTSARPGPPTNAAALIALLPQRTEPTFASAKRYSAVGTKSTSLGLVYVIVMIVVLGAQLAVGMHQQPTEPDNAAVSAAGDVSPGMPMPGVDQSPSALRGHQEKP